MNPFTAHPNSVGETYWQHLVFAMKFSLKCVLAGLFAFVHALFPFLCPKSASKIILQLSASISGSKRAD